MGSKITGFGAYLPPEALTNAKLEGMVETNDEWIVQRTGIRERRVARGEGTAALAVKAARNALADAGRTADELDLIIAATVTPDCFTPSTACLVQAELGAANAAAFDLSAACSGFVYALDAADSFIRAGKFRTVLILGAETLSRLVNYADRSTCILFGDGAGAAVVEASKEPGILSTYLWANGAGGGVLRAQALPQDEDPFGARGPLGIEERAVAMAGGEVLRFSLSEAPRAMDEALRRANLTIADIDWVVPHQANKRIIDGIIRRYHLPPEKVYVNIERYGNTSSATIPICLAEMRERGLLRAGQRLLLVGFGGGLTAASAVVQT